MKRKLISASEDPVIQTFLRRTTPIRARIEKMILFGSRARGDDRPYSDYDILVVVPEKERALVDALYEATMDVLYETQRLISLKIYRKADFEKFAALPTPFIRNVLSDGVILG